VSRILSLACSAEKKSLFESIEMDFNAVGYRDLDGTELALRCHYYDDPYVLGSVAGRDFRYFIPASAFSEFSLRDLLAQRYQEAAPPEVAYSSFAASPVVLVMSSRVYELLGGKGTWQSLKSSRWPRRMRQRKAKGPAIRRIPGGVGWHSLVAQGRELRLAHAHGTTADGLAVMTAEWVWACGGREPSAGDAAGRARDLVKALEEQVVEYAPDDRTALLRAQSAQADVVLVREDAALAAATESGGESVIVYPAEGTLWVDQVLGRVQYEEIQGPIDRGYELLSAHLHSTQTADRILTHGMHPAGSALGTRNDSARLMAAHPAAQQGSIRIANSGAAPMVLPGYQSVKIISGSWGSVAKAADICLVLDTSGSMAGSKLTAACEAIRRFCARPQSTATAVGLVTFAGTAVATVPVQPLVQATSTIESAIRSVSAGGETALFDAVAVAVAELHRAAGLGHLRVVLLLTDGEENRSRKTFSEARIELEAAGVTVFAIAYGADADEATLRRLTGESGLVVTASPRDVEEIYAALSAHV
jgi:uncharacterized protein YegL